MRHYSDPLTIQKEVFTELMGYVSATKFGTEFSLAKDDSYSDFSDKLPVQTYDSLKPYINRMLNGEKDVLCPGFIGWFAKTSGSAEDKSKFIPVTKKAMNECHFRAGQDVLSLYVTQNPDSKLFRGKGLILGGAHKINEFNNNIRYGDLSAVLIENITLAAELFRVPGKEIALMDNWELKIDKLINETLKVNITNISGVPSWMLVLMKHMLARTGKQHIHEIWPNLELFIHGAVSFEPYRAQFAKLFPSPQMCYMETYNASEGFFGIQDRQDADDMLLMLDYGIYYEFVPVEEAHNPVHVVNLENVETDRNYAMIITTSSGLWRYMIGDTVKFTSTDPFRIRITGRTKHFINAFGEELVIENAEKALREACLATDAEIRDFTAAPIYISDDAGGAHEWLIEFESYPRDPDYFAKVLDDTLKKLNSDYEAKRAGNMTLRFPRIKILPKGTFDKWLKSKNKLGGQHKVPRLSNERKYVDEILRISGNNP